MKKILLSLCLFAAIGGLQAQKEVVLNEFVPDPNVGQGKAEYIELFNTTGSTINLDCYTLVAYDFNLGGVWVYNLPDVAISPLGFVVFAATKPVNYKFGTADGANFYNWNTANATASLVHYDRSGNNLINPTGGPTQDFIPIAGGNSAALAIMLFDGSGNLTNGFFTNNGSTVPVEVTTLADLNIATPGNVVNGCAANVTLKFSTITAPAAEVLNVQQAVGNNNNYYRTRDGICGTWTKGESSPNFTPGVQNSSEPPINGSDLVNLVALPAGCGDADGGLKSSWNLSVQITDAALTPGYFRVYEDKNYSGGLDPADGAPILEGAIAGTTQQSYPGVAVQKGSGVIIRVTTASGCIEETQFFSTQCAQLPVNFKSFTATRNRSNVLLKWETASEQDNAGFSVQRNIGGTWQEIAYIPSQAPGGNSDVVLVYTLNDLNTVKGITQYRIRQVDFDGKSKLSEIRAVRGEGQLGNTVLFPNPSSNGNVTIMFADANVKRDVSVIDMSGKVIKQWRNVTNNNLQIENLPMGVFSVRILAIETGEQVVEKIVVNKR